ncbi:MAG: hypothetical protein H0U59_13375 [Gemmatimonadaceae bacterium]|nr:hypothetical protein [Gemmatimonadaceae bacterium]MDQ3242302.1 hypothetical protein [Gemmatimonadota bacterium]
MSSAKSDKAPRGLKRFAPHLPPPLRKVAWHAVDALPPAIQRLFGHTDEHRRWKMEQLYAGEGAPPGGAPTVLFWVTGGMHMLLHVEAAIAAALRLRGYNVHAVICDSPYLACIKREATDGVPMEDWRKLCQGCIASNRSVLELMGIPYSFVGDFVPHEAREDLWRRAERCTPENVLELSHNGLPVGRNVLSAVQRYMRGVPAPINERILRQYAYSGLVTAEASSRAMDRFAPTRVFMSHGVYVDWGPALHNALRREIPVTGWKASYLPARFIFRQVTDGARIDFHNVGHKTWEARAAAPLTSAEEDRLQTFLQRRYHSGVSFDMHAVKRYTGEVDRFREKYSLSEGRPVWGILTHILWDSISDYSPMAYGTIEEWLLDTVDQVCRITDVQWLIKVHPAEAGDAPVTGAYHLIRERFPDLPSHVHLIPATEEISPLEFFDIVDGGVTVYGTGGLELALAGKPVILAGEAHYGLKGFTEDAADVASYRAALARAASTGPLSDCQTSLARRYAYSLFIQRQVPLPIVRDPDTSWWKLQHQKRRELLPGAEPFMDFICDQVMAGEDFMMPPALVDLAEKQEWG